MAIRLNRIVGADGAEILVKYEGLNVGGSIKTRTALNMIKAAKKLGPGKTAVTVLPDTAERYFSTPLFED